MLYLIKKNSGKLVSKASCSYLPFSVPACQFVKT